MASTIVVLLVALGAAAGARADAADPALKAQLERISRERIFFGHQSVGMNLLDGIRRLAAQAEVPLRFKQVAAARDVPAHTFGHAFVAENGYPLRKLRNFREDLGPDPSGVDIAFVELCFLDFTGTTDAKALFAQYRESIAALQRANPGTTFVHVTAPLTTVQGGLKGFVKRLIGRPPYGILENERREEYNELLRETYGGRQPIFDLAKIESTAPDGAPVTTTWDGRRVPEMAAGYTSDGGHLNDEGSVRAARALVAVLAAVPSRDGAAAWAPR